MSDFILSLALRGAGREPVTIRPASTPVFPQDLRVGRAAESEFARGDYVWGESPRPDEMISDQPQAVRRQEPQARPGNSTTRGRESQLSEPNTIKPKSEAAAILQPADTSTPIQSRSSARETRPSGSAGESKSRAESVSETAPGRAMPRTEGGFKQQAQAPSQSSTSMPGPAPSKQISHPATTRRAARGSSAPADQQQSPSFTFTEGEVMPVAVPAATQSSEPLKHVSSSAPALVAERSGVVPSSAQPVQVHIGTIEVRAAWPPARPTAAQPVKRQGGFDDYATIRSYAGWER